MVSLLVCFSGSFSAACIRVQWVIFYKQQEGESSSCRRRQSTWCCSWLQLVPGLLSKGERFTWYATRLLIHVLVLLSCAAIFNEQEHRARLWYYYVYKWRIFASSQVALLLWVPAARLGHQVLSLPIAHSIYRSLIHERSLLAASLRT